MRDGVVSQALDCVVVAVLQDPLQLRRPDDDALVSSSAGEPFAVPGIVDAVDGVLVALEGLDEAAIVGVVDEDPLSCGDDQLRSVRAETEVVDALLVLFTVMHLYEQDHDQDDDDCGNELLVHHKFVHLVNPARHSAHTQIEQVSAVHKSSKFLKSKTFPKNLFGTIASEPLFCSVRLLK